MREERERMRRIIHGLIPWDLESFMEAHTFAGRLRNTPKDDWDHKEHSIAMDLSEQPEGIKDIVRDSLTDLSDVGLMDFSELPT